MEFIHLDGTTTKIGGDCYSYSDLSHDKNREDYFAYVEDFFKRIWEQAIRQAKEGDFEGAKRTLKIQPLTPDEGWWM